ncbi:MAG: hypothetical protein JO321_11000 [Solirubrobacterales bacterium]|nr:hypothetical protein [Solirubrobacterales bacterium]MBV9535927.1 hypothetical protein [Solirubrobacterales bacterium]
MEVTSIKRGVPRVSHAALNQGVLHSIDLNADVPGVRADDVDLAAIAKSQAPDLSVAVAHMASGSRNHAGVVIDVEVDLIVVNLDWSIASFVAADYHGPTVAPAHAALLNADFCELRLRFAYGA